MVHLPGGGDVMGLGDGDSFQAAQARCGFSYWHILESRWPRLPGGAGQVGPPKLAHVCIISSAGLYASVEMRRVQNGDSFRRPRPGEFCQGTSIHPV